MHGVDEDDLERQRIEKIKEVQEAVAKLTGAKFQKLENLQRMERMLNKEIELLQNATRKALETHLVTCNYAFYKSIIDEVEEMENATAVLKTFKRDNVSVTVDIVMKEPNVWIKLVNRPAKTVLIEYRDGKRNGDVIAQIKQHLFVSRRFNRPQIRIYFRNGVLAEMAQKLIRHGIVVIGEHVDKSDPSLRGKWNEELIERLGEEEDSDWDEVDEDAASIPTLPSSQSQSESTLPRLNLDISAVMLLVSNMCEPGGVNYQFKEEMINKHVECERLKPAKAEVLEKLKGHHLIMCELAYRRVAEIVKNVGGPTEKKRFEELSKTIERVQDQPSDEIGRVVKLRNIKGITSITKRVFSCAEVTKTTTVTANQKFLTHSRAKHIYFDVIEIPPRPLTEQKEATAKVI
ncbi:DUF1308 domain-containing protein [Caenorhabditis elegans]|uniref:DUF1308 domain-containing protein n=1 Tax=Caenorhabditis elegans TaxID=6239 RepID=Q19987_CAEEL|nr:DUF1308 domain-containing protein [Caenorhabditis elegans]CCD65792.1 DUF1308 domain-containing protein [Caenorhabditis elegans]|eukprot:NP_494927.1 Uncharacterized protein CELE_F33G12.3 [Caenorhabditis elegans]